MEIIIDGYNLIFKSSKLKRVFLNNPEEAINKLCEQLKIFKKKWKIDILLVFDASKNNPYYELKYPIRINDIRIKYCEDADAYILKRALKLRDKCIIVSSDAKDILKPSRVVNCGRIKSEDFLKKIYKIQKKSAKKYLNYKLPESEISYWMKIFNQKK